MTTEQRYRTIRELAPKPSDAIKAMIDGLRELPSKEFSISMLTFGNASEDLNYCYGCAATCALHKLANKTPDPRRIAWAAARADYLQFHVDELNLFEYSIDEFRKGRAYALLFHFYRLSHDSVPEQLSVQQDWHLTSFNWQCDIPKIEAYRQELIAAGF